MDEQYREYRQSLLGQTLLKECHLIFKRIATTHLKQKNPTESRLVGGKQMKETKFFWDSHSFIDRACPECLLLLCRYQTHVLNSELGLCAAVVVLIHVASFIPVPLSPMNVHASTGEKKCRLWQKK